MSHQLLIKDCSLVTFFNDGYNAIKILENIDLLVEDGTIRTMDRNIEADCETIDAEGKLAVPGFVNGRSRCLASKMTKAIAEDLKFDLYGNTPLYTRVNPFLNIALEILDDEQLEGLLALALYEAIDSGTTTLFEHCSLRELPIFLAQCEKAGIRTVAAPMLMDRYTFPTADAWGIFDDGLEPVDEDGIIAENVRLVEQYMHVAQSPRETRQVMQRYGKRPVELLDELGYLDRRLHTAHITETTAAERALLAERGVSMALCTGSIGIINGEIPPAQDYMALAGRVGLGTDQAPGNNCNNLFNEMKFTSILHKVKNTDPTSFPAWKVLRMATIEAAQCMGMEESVGSLRAGKKADVVLVALDTPAMSPVLAWPVRNIVPNLVYSASGSEVDTVLIDGAFVVENGRMRTIDEDAEIKRANRCAQLLCQRLEATGWEKDMPLAGWTREGYY